MKLPENRSQRIIQKSDSICRKFQNAEITNLEQLIEKNPQEESNYISLIFLYSKNDEEKKHLKLFKN
jgi:DNA-binding SARP family transcriptional activator